MTAAALARLYSADPVNPIRVPEKRAGERALARSLASAIPPKCVSFYRISRWDVAWRPADASELTRARDEATIYGKAAAFNALSFSLLLFPGESEQLGAEQGV